MRLTDATLQAGQTVLGGCVGVEEMLPGYRRFYTEDPFGIRLECMQAI